jgi:murein tripeptide amidase MpaA
MIGLLNPDGKAHMEVEKQYCWRGNARGVDLNRNADWQFNGPGSSSQPGTEEYNGGAPFSEPESQLIKRLANTHHFDAYINLHSGEQQVFVPFVDTQYVCHCISLPLVCSFAFRQHVVCDIDPRVVVHVGLQLRLSYAWPPISSPQVTGGFVTVASHMR